MTLDFPGQSYPNGALYQWRITVPEGERARLTFTTFDLVPDVCGDFVQIYDGHKAGSSLVGRFCGGSVPKPVESSGNTMVVRFKSDNSLTSKGFQATYTKSSLPPVAIPTTTTAPATTSTKTPTPPTTSGTHCGHILPPLVVSASNTISVTFQSDSRLTDRGFSAE
ncbi:hypothetical protein XENORESO_004910 [Xenotaenia resolanae]|uniref:CUB domain-containing protein n=1 Tax=Xenotaenia resolanae TaxID=208358 RepID=A0ABV0VP99_9TELE